MTFFEVSEMLNSMPFFNKNEWEQSRLIAYTIAQSNSSKKLVPQDIMKFEWEGKEQNKASEITEEDEKRLREKAQRIKDSEQWQI